MKWQYTSLIQINIWFNQIPITNLPTYILILLSQSSPPSPKVGAEIRDPMFSHNFFLENLWRFQTFPFSWVPHISLSSSTFLLIRLRWSYQFPGHNLIRIHIPAWAKGFDQDTLVFPRSGSPVPFWNFEGLRNFWKGKLQWSGPSAVAYSHATK